MQGLYCTYKCAGMMSPNDIPKKQWPRQHRIGNIGSQAKHHYSSLEEAREAALINKKDPYYDNFCGAWHIGKRKEDLERPTEVDGAVPEG